ncbi:MAG: hypothetical protein IJW50_07175 [Clostridia bacterium]|nr:hypothetical protein [Clostridia bacterium]
MKDKKFSCPDKSLFIFFLVLLFAIIFVGIYSALTADYQTPQEWIGLIFIFAILILAVLMLGYFFFPICCSKLTISEDCLIWKCPLHRTVKLAICECTHVGVADSLHALSDRHRLVMASTAHTMVSQDRFLRFIYLSSRPFSKKYEHKASWLRSNKNLILFPYTDSLCEELINVLPKGNIGSLLTFYYQLKESDKIRAKQKEKEKRKQRKKKG